MKKGIIFVYGTFYCSCHSNAKSKSVGLLHAHKYENGSITELKCLDCNTIFKIN